MHCTWTVQEGKLVVCVLGRLDCTTAGAFDQESESWLGLGNSQVILDLKDLEYLSSAGLSSLVTLTKKLKSRLGTLALCNVKGMVAKLLDIAGFGSFLPMYASLEEALHPKRDEGRETTG